MSVKKFCDLCGVEIELSVTRNRVKESFVMRRNGVQTSVLIEILCGVGTSWNSGDLCKPCLFDALDHLDPRPKAAPRGEEVSRVD